MPPTGPRRVVVGAAIFDGAAPCPRVLATQRADPPELAGMWEFPGGKVEPGESEVEALIRECREELGLVVEVGGRVGADSLTVDGQMLLRVYAARVVAGELRLAEHSDAQWLSAAEIGSVAWIPTDEPILSALGPLMSQDSR
ncbi:MAG TPA: (deoxy)nucleoside triphosphate pyrophosphohydrolase [Mycobacteriales bacterium]|nr:(deoxy)nucleoside triphosphate pyrophosphohydrolase [Mycobacteriales bacterium]